MCAAGILTVLVYQNTLWKKEPGYLTVFPHFLRFFTSLAWYRGPSQWCLNENICVGNLSLSSFLSLGLGQCTIFICIYNCLLWSHITESHEMVCFRTGSAVWLYYRIIKSLLNLSHWQCLSSRRWCNLQVSHLHRMNSLAEREQHIYHMFLFYQGRKSVPRASLGDCPVIWLATNRLEVTLTEGDPL